MNLQLKPHTAVSKDGVKIKAYTLENPNKPWLVMVHGYPDDHSVWLPVANELKDHFSLLLYDVRGAGGSERPKKIKSYALEHLANDLWAVSEQVLGGKAFHLLAHDWGSIQSWEPVCQGRFAAKILSFTSVSGPCLDHVGQQMRAGGDFKGSIKQLAHSWYIYLFHVPVASEAAWKFLGAKFSKLTGSPLQSTFVKDAQVGMRLYRANMLPCMLKPRRLRTSVPVHVIELEQDAYVTPATYKNLSQLAPHHFFSKLKGGHWAVHSKPKEVSRLVVNGIGKLS